MQTLELTSAGKLACELQAPIARIRRVAESLGIVPHTRINELDHYTSDNCERIALALAEQRAINTEHQE